MISVQFVPSVNPQYLQYISDKVSISFYPLVIRSTANDNIAYLVEILSSTQAFFGFTGIL